MMLSAFANDQTHTFVKNKVCLECHPVIYDEYTKSQHNNSTIYKDPIHAAVWKKHPKNLKKKQYGCGKCHTAFS
jgi:cytochrome c551/c552